jgi:alkylhydroperoxidase family enzyme
MSRVAPLPQPWSPQDAEGIGRWSHPDAGYDPLLLTRCLQRHPRLAQRTRALGESLYVDGLLSPRQRTLAILRTCGLIGGDYEWGGQAAFWGPITEVSEADCDALAVGSADDPRWSENEQVLLAAVDELEATGRWTEQTWACLGETLSDEQRMELVVVVGWYRMISTLCTTMDLPVEDWMRPWPSGPD